MRRAAAWLLLAPALACGPGDSAGAAGAAGAATGAGAAGAAGAAKGPGAGPVVFFAGGPSHGPGEHEYYAGATLLAGMLAQSGVAAEVWRDWPDEPATLAGAAAFVFLTDGNGAHPLAREGGFARLEPHLRRGAGLGCVHWSVHLPAAAEGEALRWLGGFYLDGLSTNPIWTARAEPAAGHPIARGVAAFELRDEWYYGLRFAAGPGAPLSLLSAPPPDETRTTPATGARPGSAETLAWAFERPDGGRSFGLTGAHFHQSWGDANLRRFAVNALLWLAGRDVPEGGAPVAMSPGELGRNLDPKPGAELGRSLAP